MKLTFESNLAYQQEAIQAVVNLFEGQMSEESGCQYSLNENGVLDLIAGIGNRLVLSKEQILANLQKVHQQNNILCSDTLEDKHFSIE